MGVEASIWLRETQALSELQIFYGSRAKHDASNHQTQPLEVLGNF
jgi:hypothetical protein